MDIYSEITNRIIAEMERGTIPWQKPWVASGSCISYATGKPYSLLNQMLLGRPGEYLTFKQCQQAGGRIRKGEKASMVVFWKWLEQEDEETGEKKEIPFLRYYNVFHIDQCEGLRAKHTKPLPNTANADTNADTIIAAEEARVEAAKASATKKIDEIQAQMRACVQALERIKSANLPKPQPSVPGSAPFDFDNPESTASVNADAVADEISHNLEALVGTTEDTVVKTETNHPASDTTSKFTNLQFGRNYDPASR